MPPTPPNPNAAVQAQFESAPGLFITPDFKIAAVNEAYLRTTTIPREELVGRNIYEVFPDNLAAKALRDSQARLNGIVNTAVDAIITINEEGLIEWLNPAALKLFGYTSEELLGQNVNLLMPEPHHSAHTGYIAEYRRTGKKKIIGVGREVEARRKDGSLVPVELSVAEVQLGDRRLFTGILRDITQRKEVDRQLREALEAAETASQAKDQFIAVLSHELRTPLTPVLTMSQMLEAEKTLSPYHGEMVKIIRRNVELEIKLINDLLDVTRIGRNKLELHMETVDVHDEIMHAVSICTDDLDAKQTNLTLNLDAAAHHVKADSARLQQILWNLLKNAIKFTPKDGSVAVTTTNRQEGRIEIVVTDDGIGIDPVILPLIFNVFEQGSSKVTRQFGGLGLGLAISKVLVERHGGHIAANSAGRGRGATFTVDLPVVKASARHPPAEAPPARTAGDDGVTLLLVDDHLDTRRTMERLLVSLGYVVKTAGTMAEAMEMIQAERFSLLISDIGLPDGSGTELMQNLKAKYGMRGIALSGYGMEEDVRKSLAAGFAHHLTKPVNFQDLTEAIHAAVSAAPSPTGAS